MRQFPSYTQEQFPPFATAVSQQKVWFYTQYQDNNIIAFACIRIRKNIFAEILFGPIVRDVQQYDGVLSAIARQLKRKGIFMLRVMPPHIDIANKGKGFETESSNFNWTSLHLRLDKELPILFKKFAQRHQASIKKAQKLGLIVSEITALNDIVLFAEGYTAMYRHRGLSVDLATEQIRFTQLFNCFQQYKNGLFLGIYNQQHELLGGICLSIQLHSMTYYKGFAHPKFRHMPISHIGIFEAIQKAQQLGKTYFDFGGYAVEPHLNEQLKAINFFKKGFGGMQVNFPMTRIYYAHPFVKIVQHIVTRLKTSSRSK